MKATIEDAYTDTFYNCALLNMVGAQYVVCGTTLQEQCKGCRNKQRTIDV